MSKHRHEWKLIDSYDSWKRPAPKSSLPNGQYVTRGGLFGGTRYIGPSAADIQLDISRRVVELINRESEPHFTSETWVCACGKRKVNSHTDRSLSDLILGKKKS